MIESQTDMYAMSSAIGLLIKATKCSILYSLSYPKVVLVE